eukprot:6474939-Amphidinium_carterae.3
MPMPSRKAASVPSSGQSMRIALKPIQEHRLDGNRYQDAGKEARAKSWNWFAQQAVRTSSAQQATSGGVAIMTPLHRTTTMIPACEQELEECTEVPMGQSPLTLCCLCAKVDPTETEVERELELLSRWIWQQPHDWMICGDFNVEPDRLADGQWLHHNRAHLCHVGGPTCFSGQPRELDW